MQARRVIMTLLLIILLSIANITIAQESTAEPEATSEASAEPEESETPEATDEATQEATDEPEATATATPDGAVYFVQPGDNLFRIALRNGLTTQQLAAANGITNPNLILVGQRLIIPQSGGGGVATPVPDSTEEPTATATSTPDDDDDNNMHIVRRGDTLFRIAVNNGTTVAELLRLNTIPNPNLIFVGQRINLPDSATLSRPSDEIPDEERPAPVADIEFAPGIEVFIDDQDINAIVTQLSQLGIEWVKITVNWALVEPTEGTLELTELDNAVETLDDAGFNIMLTLIGTPDWARPSATEYALSLIPFNGPPDDMDDFGAFAGQIAERYQGSIQAYEIWSEPNIRRNWISPESRLVEVVQGDGTTVEQPDAGLADARYIDLLEAAFTSIKDADADALVVTAGLAPTGLDDFYNSIDTFVFLENLLDQGALDFSDAIGAQLDGFANAPSDTCCGESDEEPPFDESYHFFFSDMLEDYRIIVNRNEGEDVPIWVTRFGWGTDENAIGTPEPIFQDFLTLNTEAEQAQFIVDAFQRASDSGFVGPTFLYNLNGCAVNNTEACYYSLINVSNAVRPAFNELVQVNLATTENPENTDVVSDLTDEDNSAESTQESNSN